MYCFNNHPANSNITFETDFFVKKNNAKPRNDAAGILSRREKQIMQLIAQGLGNKQIAALLFISEGTVKVHIKNIFAKLGVTNRVLALSKAGLF